MDREAKLSQHSPGKSEKAKKESKVEVLEKLGEQVAEIEAEVQSMREKVKEDYCELPTEVGQARMKLQ